MKLKTCLAGLLMSVLVHVGFAEATADFSFPEIGKKFQVEFISLGVVNEKTVSYDVSIPNGAVVQVLRHAGGTWCYVEYLRPGGMDEKTKRYRFKKEQFWLNFGSLIIVREATPAQAALPKDAIIE